MRPFTTADPASPFASRASGRAIALAVRIFLGSSAGGRRAAAICFLGSLTAVTRGSGQAAFRRSSRTRNSRCNGAAAQSLERRACGTRVRLVGSD